MKVLLLKNKISKSYKSKLDKVQEFFIKFDKIEFIEEKTNLKVVNGDYSYIDGKGEYKTFQAVDETWYDENISKPAKARGFDIVVLVIKSSSWLSKIVEGFGTSIPDYGIEEIAIKEIDKSYYVFGDGVSSIRLEGDRLTWIIIHELLHRIYNMKGLPDNTHKYFLEGKPEKCLDDFKDRRAVLTRLNDNGIQTTGVLDLYNGSKNMICYTLELAWKNNARNISSIPKGTYTCSLYNSVKYGLVYRVLNVKNRTGILIHAGNYNKDTKGCILVGNDLKDINKDGQKDVVNSKLTLKNILTFMGGENFTLTIQ